MTGTPPGWEASHDAGPVDPDRNNYEDWGHWHPSGAEVVYMWRHKTTRQIVFQDHPKAREAVLSIAPWSVRPEGYIMDRIWRCTCSADDATLCPVHGVG